MTQTEVGLLIGQAVTLIGLVVTIVVAIIRQRVPSKADDQSRVEFGVKVIEDRLAEANADRTAMRATEEFLREQLRKADERDVIDRTEILRLGDLIRSLDERLIAKDAKIREYEERQRKMAHKIGRGELITMEDIYGDPAVVLSGE